MVTANELINFLCELDNDDYDIQSVCYKIAYSAITDETNYTLYFYEDEQDICNKIIDYFENLGYNINNMFDPSKRFYNIVTISW